MAVCEICGNNVSSVNIVGLCSKCMNSKPIKNRWGEAVDWKHEYNVNRDE